MPLYNYQCYSCGLRFRAKSSRTRSDTHPCESCGSPAKKALPTKLNHGFEAKIEGLSQPNTGVSSIDYDFDRVVHTDSNKKWQVVNKRQQAKRDLVRDSKASPRHIVRVGDHYEVAGDEERAHLDAQIRKSEQS